MHRSDPRYLAALDHLLDRINFEKSTDRPYAKSEFKLARMAYLLELLGDPHLAAPVIHIAGTKGKGSVSWLMAEAFRRNGLKTGLYTSPHLVDLEERFVVDGQPIEPQELVEIVEQLGPAERACTASEHGPPTFFEMATAIGWLAFKKHRTQVNVIEVGLGGRLDSTNVCNPTLCIITNISYDHQQQLGNTLAEIASEKAGIIKPKIPVICGARAIEAAKVIEQKAFDAGSHLEQLGRDFHVHWSLGQHPLSASLEYSDGLRPSRHYALRMLGKHQADNAALAIAAWNQLKHLGWNLALRPLVESLAYTQVPARMEVLSNTPFWILDTAHNEASIDALSDTLESFFPALPKSVIFACSKDKKASEMLDRLIQIADRIILTQYQCNPRFTPVEKLVSIANELLSHHAPKLKSQNKKICQLVSAKDLPQAVQLSRLPMADPLARIEPVHVITGSFFIAAEAKSFFASNGPGGTKLTDF
jgi:dihydrofolate synthase/folylpolyglutamate synthase